MKSSRPSQRSFLALFLGFFLLALNISAEEATTQNNGTITLFNGNQHCTIELPGPGEKIVQTFVKTPLSTGPNYYCQSYTNGGQFELRDVPSATKIWLINGKAKTGQLDSAPKNCTLVLGQPSLGAHNWYELLTIKNPTTVVETAQDQA